MARLKRRGLVIIALVAVAAAIGGVLALNVGTLTDSCANTPGTRQAFAVVGDLNGFNGSRNLPPPWPVISVERCDTVVINFLNQDRQAHGLAVDFYSSHGVAPQGGESQTLIFRASKTGEFRFFCHIFCTVHIHMQNGQLVVTDNR